MLAEAVSFHGITSVWLMEQPLGPVDRTANAASSSTLLINLCKTQLYKYIYTDCMVL